MTIGNTIVSDSTTINNGTSTARDVSGAVSSQGNNLISNATGSTGWGAADKLDQPARITALGNYGGPTQTFSLLPNSPAIDMGSNANAPAVDQRGSARVVGSAIDIGSFENNPAGTVASIPGGAVGAPYTQELATTLPSTLIFAVVSGTLPPGLSLSPGGTLSGTPTTGGAFTFGVSITSAGGFVNYRQYSLFIPFTIANLNDSGVGSLRRAIVDANAAAGDDVLTFQAGLSGTLTLLTELSITSNITIIGTGANNLIINGNGVTRVLNIGAGANVGISGVTIRNGNVEGSGGGILNAGTLDLTGVVMHDNTAIYSGAASGTANGGGISNSGTLTITTSTIRNNAVSVTNLGTASGGGIANTGTTTITNSTISSNNAVGKPDARGGGISNNGTLTLINSTIGNNSALANPAASGSPMGQGGGIYNGAAGVLTVRNTTIGFNSVNATVSASGGGIFNAGTATIGNTIVSNNSTSDNGGTLLRDVSGAVSSQGNNLISNATGSTGWVASDIINQPSLITPLANYGGPTQTFGILPSSPAIDRGSNANAPAADQRGSARIVGSAIDIGSFENNPTGVFPIINNGAVNSTYSQNLAIVQPSTLIFSLVSGSLPPGLSLSSSGFIMGTPTTGGSFNFGVSITDPNGAVNFKEYALVIGCTFVISPINLPVSSAGGANSFQVITQNGCFYTVASTDSSIVTITSGPNGSGNGTVNFTVAANTGPARSASIAVAGTTFTVNQASGCAYTLAPTSASFATAGGMGSFNVTVSNSQCPYTATTAAPWITVNNGSGTGSGMVTFTVQANPGPARSGTIIVGGQTYTVNQSTGCSYTINPANTNVGANGGTGSFTVATTSICPYTAVSGVSWITVTSNGSGTGSATISFTVVSNNGAARSGTITVGGQTYTVNQAAAGVTVRPAFDFDGDGKADISVFRPNGGNWYLSQSTNGFTGVQFGDTNDKLVPADYDGDGKTDLAVYRAGVWYLLRSTSGFTGVAFGEPTDIPQPADFDGDGKAELAVWRPSNGSWYIFNLITNSFSAAQFGASTDKPVVGDYDGDGKADFAVFRPAIGTWYLQRSTAGFTGVQFGDAADKPVPADYDGDRKTDIAVFRPSNGTWYLNRSTAGFTGIQFGALNDLPVPADYDGDGRADVAVFRSGVWYLNQTTAGFTGVQFGAATDKPVPNAFVP